MNGVMQRGRERAGRDEANQAAPATPIAVTAAADARAFVQMWTVDDFKRRSRATAARPFARARPRRVRDGRLRQVPRLPRRKA